MLIATMIELERYHSADSLARTLLERTRRVFPPRHTDLARTLHAAGVVRMKLGDVRGAEPLLREALAIRSEQLDASHWEVAESESALGSCLAALGRVSEGETLMRRGYATLRARRGDSDLRTRHARDELAVHRPGAPRPGSG
jgi:serine/threonine-protein kinase